MMRGPDSRAPRRAGRTRDARRSLGALILLLTPLLTLACGSDAVEPEFTADFALFGGCADVLFYAVDARDAVMVTFYAPGLVAEAETAGVETTTVIDFPEAGVDLVVEVGSRVSDVTCDDVVENGGPDVERSWTATAGTATVTIVPGDGSSGPFGDLLLEDITFSSDADDYALLGRLEWTDVLVGWLPG